MFWKWKYKYFFLLFILKLFSLVECSLKNECIVLCFFFFLVHAKCHRCLLYNPQYLSFCPGTFVRTKQADAVIHKFVWDYHQSSPIKLVCAAAETHGCSNMVDLWTVFTVPEPQIPTTYKHGCCFFIIHSYKHVPVHLLILSTHM